MKHFATEDAIGVNISTQLSILHRNTIRHRSFFQENNISAAPVPDISDQIISQMPAADQHHH